jgi:integrase
MNVDLRPSTRRMIEESAAAAEARAFIEWLHAEHYTDYVIDCHIRRLLFLMPRLWPGTSPPVLQDAQLAAEFGRERQPRSRFFNFAGTRRIKRGAVEAPIEYFDRAELDALLKSIDRFTGLGRRDYALFALMFNTGAPVQEALDVWPNGVRSHSDSYWGSRINLKAHKKSLFT